MRPRNRTEPRSIAIWTTARSESRHCPFRRSIWRLFLPLRPQNASRTKFRSTTLRRYHPSPPSRLREESAYDYKPLIAATKPHLLRNRTVNQEFSVKFSDVVDAQSAKSRLLILYYDNNVVFLSRFSLRVEQIALPELFQTRVCKKKEAKRRETLIRFKNHALSSRETFKHPPPIRTNESLCLSRELSKRKSIEFIVACRRRGLCSFSGSRHRCEARGIDDNDCDCASKFDTRVCLSLSRKRIEIIADSNVFVRISDKNFQIKLKVYTKYCLRKIVASEKSEISRSDDDRSLNRS